MPRTLEDIDLGDVSPEHLIKTARTRGCFVFDLETTGLNAKRHRIEGIAFYVPEGPNNQALRAWYPFVKNTMRVWVHPDETPEEQAARIRYERTNKKEDHEEWVDLRQAPQFVSLIPALNQEDTMEALRPLFEESPDVYAIAHNAKFDVAFLRYASGCERGYWQEISAVDRLASIGRGEEDPGPWGFSTACRIADSMQADFLCDENHFAYGLKGRVKAIFDHDMVTYGDVMKRRNQGTFGFMSEEVEALGTYAMADCYWTWRLFEHALEELNLQTPGQELGGAVDALARLSDRSSRVSPFDRAREMGNLERIYWNIDMKITLILEEMETRGILIDWKWLKKVTEKLEEKKDKIIDEIEQQLGFTINPNSAPQVATVLFAPKPTGLGLPTKGIARGKTGQYSTGSKEISHLSRVHPVVKLLLDWRSCDTIQSNFSIKLATLVQDEDDNRCYSHFNQTGTKIHRLSCVSGSTDLRIRVGDDDYTRSTKISELLSFAGQDVRIVTHKGRERRITHLVNKGPGLMFDVETEDGATIRCTQEHRFLTERGWRALKDIRVGDQLLRAEVCEAQAASGRSPLGAGPSVVPADLRGGQARGALEDPRLRSVERDRVGLQGDLRVGVPAPVPGHADEVGGSGRDPADVPDLRAFSADQGVSAHGGIVQDRVRGQRSDAGGSEGEVRDLAPGDDPCGQVLRRGVLGVAQGEAGATHQRTASQFGSVLLAERTGEAPGRWTDHRGDRGEAQGGSDAGAHGSTAPRDRQITGQRVAVVGQPVAAGVGCVGAGQPGHGEPDWRGHVGLPGHDRDVSTTHRAVGHPQEKLGYAQVATSSGRTSEVSADVRRQSARDATLSGVDRSRGSAPTLGVLLQELAGGLRVAREEADGRGRWRISPEVRDDAGARPSQGEEGEGAGLHGAAVHDRGRGTEAAHGRPQDRPGAWVRVASITPAGVETVWDISVEGDESYVAHGFVNHNSSDPINLQNLPRDRELIRRAVCAYLEGDPADLMLFGCDYSQIELRVAAHLSGDKGMIEVYNMVGGCKHLAGAPCKRYQHWECDECHHLWIPGDSSVGACPKCGDSKIAHQRRCRHVDLHQRTAEDVGVPRNPLAKNLNFGSLYRIGAERFCQYADLYDDKGNAEVDYARGVLKGWYEAYPAIEPFHLHMERTLRGNGWISRTLTGRQRRLDRERYKNEFRAVTQGIQFAVSGSAQDILKIAMVRIWEEKWRRVLNSRPAERKLWSRWNFLLQVHDEIMMEGPPELKDEIIEIMTTKMEGAAALRVPLVTDVKTGRNWDNIH